MKKICVLLVGSAAFLAGCDAATNVPQPNQELRAKLFMQCLERVPKGPERVGESSDWHEVVSECGSQAYYMSLRGGPSNL